MFKEWIKIWQVDLLQPASIIESLRAVLSQEESARAERYAREDLQRRFIVGRGILRQLLGQITKIPPGEIQFTYNSYGKPQIDPQSVPQNQLYQFSVSHTDDLALLAVTNLSTVGVDVERHRKIDRLESLARRYFSEGENALWMAMPVAARIAAFFAIWTRKEAFIKAIGRGLAQPLDRFTVNCDPKMPARLLALHDHPSETANWRIADLTLKVEAYSAAVVAPAGNWHIQWEILGF